MEDESMKLTPFTEIEPRVRALQRQMSADGLDAVIIAQNADLFYFTGTIQSGNLYVPASGDPVYMVRRDLARARSESCLKEIVPFASMRDIPGILSEYGYSVPGRIGMELDVLPVNLFDRYRKVFPAASWVDATPLIRRVRMIKSPYELTLMRAAAVQLDTIYRAAAGIIREGMSGIELAAELELLARRDGHQGLIRMRGFNGEMMYAHVFSGTDTAVPAYTDTPLGGVGPHPGFGQGASWRRIARNEPIILDFAGSVEGYLVDQTRLYVIGALSDRLRKGYDDMRKIEALMCRIVSPGVTWGEVYDRCCALAIEMGYADSFMGAKGAKVSFIGHGLGVEIDEYPFIARGFDDVAFETGMAFAFEPKVVFPGEGAAGIENTFHLSGKGLERLTISDEAVVKIR
jgi:Xaa-Pro dipeptidase